MIGGEEKNKRRSSAALPIPLAASHASHRRDAELGVTNASLEGRLFRSLQMSPNPPGQKDLSAITELLSGTRRPLTRVAQLMNSKKKSKTPRFSLLFEGHVMAATTKQVPRIDRLVSNLGFCRRRDANSWIRHHVRIDGSTVPPSQSLRVDPSRLTIQGVGRVSSRTSPVQSHRSSSSSFSSSSSSPSLLVFR